MSVRDASASVNRYEPNSLSVLPDARQDGSRRAESVLSKSQGRRAVVSELRSAYSEEVVKRGKPIPQSTIDFVMKRAWNRCEVMLPEICERRVAELHHVKSRKRGGSNDPINCMAVCRPCHDAIERHRTGTDRYRTYSYQREGERESDFREAGS